MTKIAGCTRGKIDLQNVLSSLNTPCPKCGHQITPAEIKRVSREEIECPQCGECFDASKTNLHRPLNRSDNSGEDEHLGLYGSSRNVVGVMVWVIRRFNKRR